MKKKLVLCLISIGLVISVFMSGSVTPVQAAAVHTDWAILIAGGYNTQENNAAFWNDIGEMYEILTDMYGYTADHIFVLYANGNPPTSNNCHDPGNVLTKYPTTGVIDFAATRDNLAAVTNTIADLGGPYDTLFVYTTDHGEDVDHGLCLWGQTISPATFAGTGYIGKITQYSWRAFEMQECFSGAFVHYLSAPRTAIATACTASESAYGNSTYDPFSFYFNSALKGADPYGAAVNADANDDGQVSFMEAFNYAQSHDQTGESPQYDDNGDRTSHGGQMPIGGEGGFGARIMLCDHIPIADAGEDQIIGKTGEYTSVTLDGSGSWDPDGDELSYIWTWYTDVPYSGIAFGERPTISLPQGTTRITLSVTDRVLWSDQDTVDITVRLGGVQGLVSSTTGTPLPYSTVTVKNSLLQVVQTVQTNSTGRYAIALLPGIYIVWASHTGFYDLGQPVAVSAGVYTTLNFQLTPSSGGGGCPFLYVWDGNDYVDEGLLDIHNAEGVDVTYEHVLMTVPARVDGAYAFRLVEHPKTISDIDQVQLYAVLEDGTLEEHPLISAQHSEDGNVLNLLLKSDDRRVQEIGADHNGGTSQSIDLKFAALNLHTNVIAFIFTIEGYNMICKVCD